MSTRSAQRQLVACTVKLNMLMDIMSRAWTVDGLTHSIVDLPAVQWTDDDTCQWCKHGKLHRTGGRPSSKWLRRDNVMCCIYHLYGDEVTRAESAAYKDEDEA